MRDRRSRRVGSASYGVAVTTVTTAWVTGLTDALGSDGVLPDPDVAASYARDEAVPDWLEREIGPVSADVHRSIRTALDPSGLLNPGKVLRRGTR